jgi:hypothetical protein
MTRTLSHPIRARARLGKARKSEISQEAERALALLSGDGAYGLEGEKSDIVVVGPRNGVSVRVGSFRQSVLAPLLAAGLALWEAAEQQAIDGFRAEVVARMAKSNAPGNFVHKVSALTIDHGKLHE